MSPSEMVALRDGPGPRWSRSETVPVRRFSFDGSDAVIEQLHLDWDGRIWAERSTVDPIEDGPIDPVSASGEYLGTIQAAGARIPAAARRRRSTSIYPERLLTG